VPQKTLDLQKFFNKIIHNPLKIVVKWDDRMSLRRL